MIVSSFSLHEIYVILKGAKSKPSNNVNIVVLDPKSSVKIDSGNLYKTSKLDEYCNKFKKYEDKEVYYVAYIGEHEDSNIHYLNMNSGTNYYWNNYPNNNPIPMIKEKQYRLLTKDSNYGSMWLVNRKLQFISDDNTQWFFSKQNFTVCTNRFPNSFLSEKNHIYNVNFHAKQIIKSEFVHLYEDRLAKKKIKDKARREKSDNIDKENQKYYDTINKRYEEFLSKQDSVEDDDE